MAKTAETEGTRVWRRELLKLVRWRRLWRRVMVTSWLGNSLARNSEFEGAGEKYKGREDVTMKVHGYMSDLSNREGPFSSLLIPGTLFLKWMREWMTKLERWWGA